MTLRRNAGHPDRSEGSFLLEPVLAGGHFQRPSASTGKTQAPHMRGAPVRARRRYFTLIFLTFDHFDTYSTPFTFLYARMRT